MISGNKTKDLKRQHQLEIQNKIKKSLQNTKQIKRQLKSAKEQNQFAAYLQTPSKATIPMRHDDITILKGGKKINMRLKTSSFASSYRPRNRYSRPCTAKPIMSQAKTNVNYMYSDTEPQSQNDLKSINIVTTDRSLKQINSNTVINNLSQNDLKRKDSDYVIPEIDVFDFKVIHCLLYFGVFRLWALI